MANVRPIWKGVVSFGMVTIPVKLFGATESKDVAFNTLHNDCKSRLKQKRWCPVEDREVFQDEVVRAFEYSRDVYIEVNDTDLNDLPVPTKHTVELTTFVSATAIDRIYAEKAYWLEPEPVGAKPYALLLRTMEARNVMGVGKVALRNKERICTLRAYNGVLLVETMFWPDEVREPSSGTATPMVEPSEPELAMASMLVDSMHADFDPSLYRDEYRIALMDMIQRKANGDTPNPPAGVVVVPPQGDLMAALRASIAANKKSEPEPAPEQAPTKPRRSKKAA